MFIGTKLRSPIVEFNSSDSLRAYPPTYCERVRFEIGERAAGCKNFYRYAHNKNRISIDRSNRNVLRSRVLILRDICDF